MKLQLSLSLLCVFISSAIADPIQITAQCSGSPVREAARNTSCPTAIKLLAKDTTEPLRAICSGNFVTLEMIREFRYPTVLTFNADGAPITPKKFVTKNLGLTITLTATREGDQAIFHGTCTIRRAASTTMAVNTTPKKQPSVASAAFITRECDFAGRTPMGTPAKVNIGEQGVDAGELTLTFTRPK